MVEVAGFEPALSCSQSRRDTRLRYTSMNENDGAADRTRTDDERSRVPGLKGRTNRHYGDDRMRFGSVAGFLRHAVLL